MRKKPEPEPGGIDVEVDIDPEHEWRCSQLRAAGFSDFQAFRLSMLAADGADWRKAVQMREAGADFATIYDILG